MNDGMREIPYQVVDITSPGMNALLGRYFIGQSEELNFGLGYDAWSGIINPADSGVDLFFDIFTITNFSEVSYTSEIWFNAGIPKDALPTPTVTPSNQTFTPPPKPKAVMKYADFIAEPVTSGVNIFDRIVTPNSTLVSDSHKGSMIIGPGGSFSIFLKSPGMQMIQGRIVLTWWEERTNSYHTGCKEARYER